MLDSDSEWVDSVRDDCTFPAFTDFLYGVDTRPSVYREPGLHPQMQSVAIPRVGFGELTQYPVHFDYYEQQFSRQILNQDPVFTDPTVLGQMGIGAAVPQGLNYFEQQGLFQQQPFPAFRPRTPPLDEPLRTHINMHLPKLIDATRLLNAVARTPTSLGQQEAARRWQSEFVVDLPPEGFAYLEYMIAKEMPITMAAQYVDHSQPQNYPVQMPTSQSLAGPSQIPDGLSHIPTTPSHILTTPYHFLTTPSQITPSPSQILNTPSRILTAPTQILNTPPQVLVTPSHTAGPPFQIAHSPSQTPTRVPKPNLPPVLREYIHENISSFFHTVRIANGPADPTDPVKLANKEVACGVRDDFKSRVGPAGMDYVQKIARAMMAAKAEGKDVMDVLGKRKTEKVESVGNDIKRF
ncbi:hypothetical protein GQ44DRAFT_731032 [Phaeosphaeriaceae sp. PMI808]|nr:hypothetical protein GQ44DRAFT_731032 [Phaeosphaeriaceae sp. PMI808]